MASHSATIYDDKFFNRRARRTLEAAQVIIPIVLDFVSPQSVIDVGCGQGVWLKVFQEHGIASVHGVDGTYVNQSQLLISQTAFRAVDLDRPFKIEGRYDLALCLEVAEHLPAATDEYLIRTLTSIAPLVLFSAAIPGQGGVGHINEQWPRYWKKLFAQFDYQRFDFIRPRIWQESRVAYWYRQNVFLFASNKAIANSEVLGREAQRVANPELECINGKILEQLLKLAGSSAGS